MKRWLFLWCMVCVSVGLSQQHPRIELRFRASDEIKSGVLLRCGVDGTATDGIDSALGEYSLPGHPPSDFHAAWEVTIDGWTDLSYVDFRPYPTMVDTTFAIDYTLNISPKFTRGELIIFRWDYPLPLGIDSVRLTDRLGGNLVSIGFDERRNDTISGSYAMLERFLVRVYFNPARTSSVGDKSSPYGIVCTGDVLEIPVASAPRSAHLYSLSGNMQELTLSTVSGRWVCQGLSRFSPGWYLLVITSLSGSYTCKPLLLN